MRWKTIIILLKAIIANHVLECEGIDIHFLCIVCTRWLDKCSHRVHTITISSFRVFHRISQALDTCTELFNEECIDFDKTASSEEERAYLMCNVLSANADTTRGLPLDDVVDCQHDDDDAIHQ